MYGLPETGKVVALLPGSRIHEARALTGVLLDAATALRQHDPSLRFVLPPA